MNAVVIASTVFALILSGAMLGMWLRAVLPQAHLEAGSMDVIKLATGLIATLSALVLSLMISSAKSSFDRINNSMIENAARIVMLDHALQSYGKEAVEVRVRLKKEYGSRVRALTSGSTAELTLLDTPGVRSEFERILARVAQLAPTDEAQKAAKARALQIGEDIVNTRALTTMHMHGSIAMPLLFVLACWLVLIFTAFGLIGARNRTVFAALFFGAAAAAGAILLILEMDQPFGGLITISGDPLRDALSHLGKN